MAQRAGSGPGVNVDAVAAAGDVVIVDDGERAHVLAERDGRELGTIASDDGGAARAIAVVVADTTLVITAERGRVIARLPGAGMLPTWSIAVDGVVRALQPAGAGVLVELEDGDAYRVDARTAAIAALPALYATWHAGRDVLVAEAIGGAIPPATMPTPPPPPRVPVKPLPPEEAPAIATPWVMPQHLPASVQLALHELGGGLRARNDYALAPPVSVAAARGSGSAPIVIGYGADALDVLVVDAARGDPLRRVHLPDDARRGALFGAAVDGKPVAGVVLVAPLRVVLF